MVAYSLREHIKEVISRFFEVETRNLKESDTMRGLGAGEIYLLEELMYRLEDEFGVQFSGDEDISGSMTVEDLVYFVVRKKTESKKVHKNKRGVE